MNNTKIKEALAGQKAFTLADSFVFAAHIPDKTVGISGARCSNCGSAEAFIHQICRSCGLPFIGPGGFPEWPEWQTLAPKEKKALVAIIFSQIFKGRIVYGNVQSFPLTHSELQAMDRVWLRQESNLFFTAHGIEPWEIKNQPYARYKEAV